MTGVRRSRTRRRSSGDPSPRRRARSAMSSRARTARSLSPTRSMIAWNSSSAEMPCWIELITSNSPARCSVSRSSRSVSSNSNALSSATPTLEAIVDSSRTSASPNAFSWSRSSRSMLPITVSRATIGTANQRFRRLRARDRLARRRAWRVDHDRQAASHATFEVAARSRRRAAAGRVVRRARTRTCRAGDPIDSSNHAMPMFSTPSDSRRLSPTRSMMPAKSTCAAMPCWIELIAASSVVRCSVSRRRRCVSSNSRAFSSATPMLPATVVSSRSSLSPNAYSRS